MALDLGTATTALVALAAVLGLIVICARAMRRFGLTPGPSGGAGRRLAVLEVLPLDGKRRLVLLRCDAREVLVLTGGPKDVVLQTSGSAP